MIRYVESGMYKCHHELLVGCRGEGGGSFGHLFFFNLKLMQLFRVIDQKAKHQVVESHHGMTSLFSKVELNKEHVG